jgi:hypothetical protein
VRKLGVPQEMTDHGLRCAKCVGPPLLGRRVVSGGACAAPREECEGDKAPPHSPEAVACHWSGWHGSPSIGSRRRTRGATTRSNVPDPVSTRGGGRRPSAEQGGKIRKWAIQEDLLRDRRSAAGWPSPGAGSRDSLPAAIAEAAA